jgi:Bacterial cadherin-like domain
MRAQYERYTQICAGLFLSVLLASHAAAAQQQVNLTAEPQTAYLPDGSTVPMWGYACGTAVSGSTASCAALNPAAASTATTIAWSPVVITVPTGQPLTINLTNDLLVPTSLVIVGQVGGGLGSTGQRVMTPSPSHATQGTTWPIVNTGSTFKPPDQPDRVQSFATEVPAALISGTSTTGTTTSLTWASLRPGTYLLESGTHPSIQGPMGLYGILVVTSAPAAGATGTAYPGVSYAADVPLLLSEIDPWQNQAVATAVATPGFSETSVRVLRTNVSGLKIASAGTGYVVGDAVSFLPPTGACVTPPVGVTVTAVDAQGGITALSALTPNTGLGCAQLTTAITSSNPQATGGAISVVTNLVGTQCSGGAAACYPAAVNYTPLYYLFNGQAFDKTQPVNSLFAAAPGGVTGSVLVRLVNAGLRMHVPAIVGSTVGGVPGFGLVAEDGNPLPGQQRVQSEVFLAAGKTYDVLIDNATSTASSLPIYDRELSLAANSSARDGGMLAYIGLNGGGVPAGISAAASANNDSYAVTPGRTLTITDPAKGVLANDVNVSGATVSVAPVSGALVLNLDGTFTYAPTSTWGAGGVTSDSFQYCGNRSTSACATVSLGLAASEAGTDIVLLDSAFTATAAAAIGIKPPGVLAGASSKYPITVDATTVTPSSANLSVTAEPGGGFNATASAPGTYSFTFNVKDQLGVAASRAATVTLTFPAGSNLQVTVLDGADKVTPITDYRWVIEEDRTFFVDPNCTQNPLPASCAYMQATANGNPINFGTNFHTSWMPMIATGCTGPLSCEGGQTQGGAPVACDQGNGACRTGVSQFNATFPKDVLLDPNKRYYISILPGDAANPFIGGNLSAPTNCTSPYNADGTLNTACGHGMGGAPIARGQNAVTVLTQPTPLPTGKISVFVFQDDYPLNGQHDAGGGVDVLSPNEAGLGGFEVTIFDNAGGTGDATGQPTYDMFNNPLTNSLAGTVDPITGADACPISPVVTQNTTKGDGKQKGIVGMIVTCPTFESDGKTLSPLAGLAVITNMYPGRYGIVATPGADRIARGEEWLQTNTLDGQKAHDSFVRVGEPVYFQEFGPAGYHVTIGFANPQIINDRRKYICQGQACPYTVKGVIHTARMSRTPDQRLYESGSRDSFAFTQCYVSLGDPDGADFAFAKCDSQGNFFLPGVPPGNWKLTIFDQWNDQIIDGISAPVLVGTSTAPGGVVDLGSIGAHQWQANLFTHTFIDSNGNGLIDPGEGGLALIPTNIHFRDGSFSNRNNTDLSGSAGFNEIFPLFNWYVVETDTTRYKNTGVHIVYDAGGPTDGSSPGGVPCSNSTSTNPCGNSAIAQFYANTYEPHPLPADLSLPGAVYCADGDCTGESIANGPKPGSVSNHSTSRIDPPYWWGSYGFQGFAGQNNFIEWGKKPYATGETGGITGGVVYASTRPYDDPQMLIQNPWEPQIPHVRVNLYREDTAPDGVTVNLTLVDYTYTSSFDDWVQGYRTAADGVTPLVSAAGGYIPNLSCPGQSTSDLFFYGIQGQPQYLDFYANGAAGAKAMAYGSQFKCYDGMHNWNQLQPAPFDGMYSFPSVTAMDPVTGKPTGTNCTGCTKNPDTTDPYRAGTPMLPAGKYVVEVVVPPGYELVKEEDKNILIGDNYIAPATLQFPGLGSSVFILPDQATVGAAQPSVAGTSNASNPQNPTADMGRTLDIVSADVVGTAFQNWPCVGQARTVPDFISLFPQSAEVAPFAGATRHLCDRKEVDLTEQTAAQAKFYLFTSTHLAAHFTGIIMDDFTAEFDPFSPQFGEKFSPAYLPVAVRDWAGNEINRIYSDAFGLYNGLNYSTWEVNPPNPTGYGPTMMVMCMNDSGNSSTVADPLYQPGYSQFCYELAFMPAQTGYFDTPVTPTASFSAGANHPDCNYPDATPGVSRVDGDAVGPYVAAAGNTLTIKALGDQQVESYAFSGPQATTAPWNQKRVTRHYGFGSQCTAADGVTCMAVSTVTIGGALATITSWTDGQITVQVPATVPACALSQQAAYGGSPARCGQLEITSGNGKKSNDTVTVTVGGKAPLLVSKTAAANGSTVFNTIQSAIDAGAPGDLVIIDAGVYNEMVQLWKPLRLQGVGATAAIIDANTHPAGKLLDPWRKRLACLFGLTQDGRPNPTDTSCIQNYGLQYAPPADSILPTMIVDRLPMEAVLGWDAALNGNLAEQLIEPSVMGAYEGATITVLGKGIHMSTSTDAWGTAAGTPAAYPPGSTLLLTADCSNPGDPAARYPSNFYCNPSSVDGLGMRNSSQGGGGLYVHGWAHNLQIANNRIYNNTGTLGGGITIGQGEHIDVQLYGSAQANDPPSCEDPLTYGAGNVPAAITNQGLPFCYDVHVNIHHNWVTQNSSLGDELFSSTPSGGGGVTICNGSDYYKLNNNWLCGNVSVGDGGGFAHIGYIKQGAVEHNAVLFNQSTNPTIATNGGGILVMGAPDADPTTCGVHNDKDCVPTLGSVLPSDGTGLGLVINANLVLGNGAEAGSGGGIRLQHVNGNDMVNLPNGAAACPSAASCAWNSVTLTNNIVANNVSGWDGAGVSLQDAVVVNVVNNTIISNDSTASSGVLFGSLFAPLASVAAQGGNGQGLGQNCYVNNPGAGQPFGEQSCPQVAGLVAETNSPNLTANLTPPVFTTPVSCPPGHGAGNSCIRYSMPLLFNDIIWHNRAFVVGVGGPASGDPTLSQQNTVQLYNSNFTGAGGSAWSTSLALSQNTTGACPAGGSYWDIGVRGDQGPQNHDSSQTLLVTNSVLSDVTGYVGNSSADPLLTALYCNGARTPPEAGAFGGFQVPPGTNEANATPYQYFTLSPAAVVDEGNNWLNLRWGPLALSHPVSGATLADAHLTPTSTAIDKGAASLLGVAAPSADFYGVPRPSGAGYDIGAAEFPRLSLAPGVQAFGNQAVLTTSAPLTFTVTNPVGAPDVTLGAVTVTTPSGNPDYAVTANTCTGALTGGSSCTFGVTFTPYLLGSRPGTVSIATSQGALTAALTGTGTGAPFTLTPSPLVFPATLIGNTATLSLTARNNEPTATALTGLPLANGFPANFAITGGTCATGAANAVASAGTCSVAITFTPTLFAFSNAGIRTALLTLQAAAGNTTASLSGIAIRYPVSVTPTGAAGNGLLAFGNTQIGQQSAAQVATLSNYQSSAVTVNSIAVPSQFQVVAGPQTTCTDGAVLPAANGTTPSTCTVAFVFAPNAQDLFFGFNLPWFQTATFNLTGATPNPTALLVGTAFNSAITGTAAFGNQAVGTSGAAHVFTYRNTGATPVSLTSVTVSGGNAADFLVGATTCSGTLSNVAPGNTCTVSVTFKPSAVNGRSTTLNIADTIGTQTLGLTGVGLPDATAGFTWLNGGTVGNWGTAAANRTITITNTGPAGSRMVLAGVPVVSGSFARVGGTCANLTGLNQGGTCTVVISRSAAGAVSGSLSVSFTGGTATPATLNLTGN